MFSFNRFWLFILCAAAFSSSVVGQAKSQPDYTKKIEAATPAVLPQTPIAAKLKSDAQDDNLKGKVKSVVEEIKYADKKDRQREAQNYYDESGNYVKTVSFLDGFPEGVTVWGYLDGNRVSKTGDVSYAAGERPEFDGIIARVEDNLNNPQAPKDTRYSVMHKYKYENGRLAETRNYVNNGELWSREIFNYKANQVTELHYGEDGSQWSKTIIFLDKDGNVVERHLTDAQDKVAEMESYSYEFDQQGNWIVQKAFTKKIVKGKKNLRLWFVSYRTITYYQ